MYIYLRELTKFKLKETNITQIYQGYSVQSRFNIQSRNLWDKVPHT